MRAISYFWKSYWEKVVDGEGLFFTPSPILNREKEYVLIKILGLDSKFRAKKCCLLEKKKSFLWRIPPKRAFSTNISEHILMSSIAKLHWLWNVIYNKSLWFKPINLLFCFDLIIWKHFILYTKNIVGSY